jgi:hypothetical protein
MLGIRCGGTALDCLERSQELRNLRFETFVVIIYARVNAHVLREARTDQHIEIEGVFS